MRYRFAQFEFDAGQLRLFGPAGELGLRRQTLRALQVLLERAPVIVSRDELLDSAWGHQAVSANAVSQSVLELRRALGDSAEQGAIIETRHRLGYRIVPPVHTEPSARSAQGPSDGSASVALPAVSARRRLAVALAVFATACANVLLWWSIPRSPSAADLGAVLHDQAPGGDAARADYWAGLLALRDGRLAESIGLLDRARVQEPGSAAITASLADALLRSGRYADARATLASLSLDAARLSRSDLLRWEALAATARHDRREARSRYQAIFVYEPGDRDAGHALFDLHLAFADAPAAAQTLAELAAQSGGAPSARLLLARARLAALAGDQELRATEARAAASAAAAETALRLLAGLELCEVHLARARLARAQDCAAELESGATALGHARVAARSVAIQGVALREAGRMDEAERLFASASATALEQGDRIAWRDLELEHAMLERMRGEFDAALARLQRIEQSLDQGDDRPGQARLLGVRGVTLAQAGRVDEARAALQASIDQAVALDLRQVEAGSRNNLGLLHARSDRASEATTQLERALVLFRALGEQRGSATALSNLAILAGREGQTQRARALNREALDLFREIGADGDVARIQFNLGLAERREGSLDEAARRIEEALLRFRTVGASAHEAQAAASLAQIELDRGRPAAAREILDRITADAVEDPLRRAALQAARGRTELLSGRPAAAGHAFESALALRRQAGSPAWVLVSELDLARVALVEGGGEAALAEALRLAPAFDALGERADALRAGLLAIEALLASGRDQEARERLQHMAGAASAPHDADIALQLQLLQLAALGGGEDGLAMLASRAREQGRGLLAMRAELLASRGSAASQVARERVRAQGLSVEVLQPAAADLVPEA